ESLAGLRILGDLGCRELVDFGSGGGFPALPLAIAGAGARWTLVESRRNKTLFLRRVVQVLELGKVEVLTSRLEALVRDGSIRCDGFTSRATAKLGPTLALASSFLRPGGHAILWKGSAFREELAACAPAIRETWSDPSVRELGQSG